jgi:hypothetical protein
LCLKMHQLKSPPPGRFELLGPLSLKQVAAPAVAAGKAELMPELN